MAASFHFRPNIDVLNQEFGCGDVRMSDKLQFVDAEKVTDDFIGRQATDKTLGWFFVGAFFGASNVAFLSLSPCKLLSVKRS